MSANVVPTVHAPITWDSSKLRDQVNELYTAVQKKVEDLAQWYVRKKKHPALMSRILRRLAIVGTILGGLCPVLEGAVAVPPSISLNDIGYVLLAVAGAAVLGDRFGGFSSAWMRYAKTHLQLDGMLDRFHMEWVIACAQYDLDAEAQKDPSRLIALVDKLRVFTTDVSAVVDGETQAWMVEFQNQLAMLQKATEKSAQPQSAKTAEETATTGEVNVTVANFEQAKNPVYLFIDGAPVDPATAKLSILKARTGTHEIGARTLYGDQVIKSSVQTTVAAGKAADVSLTLPFPQ
ncbi:MAG TPA: SLATT domain-containing protein [Thermoanaerobaculia bacterium]|nr:SLATT domain-containing protein [Thermoanaerobaculia bacterium]